MNKNTTETGLVEHFISKLLKRKNPDDMIEASKATGLKKTLNATDLIILGIGAVIGSGIFVMAGTAAAGGIESVGAGPALIVSVIIAAMVCIFPALCYAEFSSMIPIAGSAYTYTFATMGEFAAWMIGWILMLEYAIGNICVASAWTGYFFQLLRGFPMLPEWIKNPPIWLVNDYRASLHKCAQMGWDPMEKIPHLFNIIPISINIPAICIVIAITFVLIKGIKESTQMAGIMVIIKLAVIFIFIAVGAFYVDPGNWVPFAPNGFNGIFMGAFIIFYAYIGFDAISTAAEETENPQKNLPIGIIGSLIITTVIYALVALVLTGMVLWSDIDTKAPIAAAMQVIHIKWLANSVSGLIAFGALVGLTSVLLVLQLGTTRILYAMSRDNFFSKRMTKLHPKYNTPHIITWAVAVICIVGSLFLDMNAAAELCNYGTFTSFIIVCVGVLILRKTDPNRHRPFRVPFSPWFPILGIICCGGLMFYAMPHLKYSAMLFPLWLLVGVIIYFMYGYPKNRRVEKKEEARILGLTLEELEIREKAGH